MAGTKRKNVVRTGLTSDPLRHSCDVLLAGTAGEVLVDQDGVPCEITVDEFTPKQVLWAVLAARRATRDFKPVVRVEEYQFPSRRESQQVLEMMAPRVARLRNEIRRIASARDDA